MIPKNFTVTEPQYEIKTEEFSLQFKKLDKQLPVRISYPVGKTRFPVIVFSHGNGSKGDMYKGFTDYWASHGYVVIQHDVVFRLDRGTPGPCKQEPRHGGEKE